MIKKILPIFLLLSVFFSCKKQVAIPDEITWIGGQIVNPKLDYIIFSKGRAVLDTVKLDSNNFFLYRTDKIKEGLYTLKHNENQVFYLRPGDSLLLHLNTIEFDESLAFSGKGGVMNNFLMDLYLRNERENKLLPTWYTLSPKDFIIKIDSIYSLKESDYRDFLSKNEVGPGFREVAETSFTYDYFSKKELYAMGNRSRAEIFDDHFFDHRKNIDFNKEQLRFYYPYYRFLERYFNSVVIGKNPPGIDRNSYEFGMEKMEAINNTVSNDSVKNSLLRYTAFRYLSCAKEPDQEKSFFKFFSTINNNAAHLQEVEKLTEATIKLSRGNPVPNVPLLSTDNAVTYLHQLVSKPTVLFFWTGDSPDQAKRTHSRSAELKSKYPEYDFLGINTDNHFKKWRNTVKNLGYDPSREFQLENLHDAEKKLVLNRMNKSMILDKNATILDGNTNMFDSNFEELLLGFLNR